MSARLRAGTQTVKGTSTMKKSVDISIRLCGKNGNANDNNLNGLISERKGGISRYKENVYNSF